MKLGQLLAIVNAIPGAVEDIPHVSAPDYAVLAGRLEHVARCVRLLGECQACERQDAMVPDEIERARFAPVSDAFAFDYLTGGRT